MPYLLQIPHGIAKPKRPNKTKSTSTLGSTPSSTLRLRGVLLYHESRVCGEEQKNRQLTRDRELGGFYMYPLIALRICMPIPAGLLSKATLRLNLGLVVR